MSEVSSIYQELKLAARLFGKSLEALEPSERQRVQRVAVKQQDLERLILGTPEAAAVMLPRASVDASCDEIRQRYADLDDYRADLARWQLDEAGLRAAIERDMTVEAVLEKVAARAACISDTEIEIFWFMHKDRFRRPETRTLRHILVTVNDTLPGNERDAALTKIEAIRQRLLREPERFAEQALKHSECPTAMNGGLLGNVPAGQLYPQLEAAAFALPAGGLSDVLETELGFHLVRCDEIQPEHVQPLSEARIKIREHLEQQRRSVCQKSWINSLRGSVTA